MRPLRPAALQTDTSIRFLLAIAALTSASLYLFQALWLLVRSQAFLDVISECPPIGPGATATLEALVDQQRLAEDCRSGVSLEQAFVELVGLGLVLGVAWLIYRAWPRLRERRQRLEAPDPRDSGALLGAVASLADGAGVDPPPEVRIDATNPRITGLAYGAGRDMRVGMGGGLVVAHVLDRPAFDAVVRHELGHIASRDVRWTYYAVAAWWSFIVVALAPVVLAFAFRDLDYLLRLGWRTAVLSLLVAVTVAALLRTRELYADARALEWGSGEALDRVLAASPPPATRRPAALRLHPAATDRRALLTDPDGLFSASGWVALAAALAAGTAFFSIVDLITLVAPSRALAGSALLVAPLLAVVVCSSAWRMALRETVRGIPQPGVLQLGLGVGVGLAAAPLLSVQAAVGSLFVGPEGWAGYAVWSIGMVLISLLLVRWVCDSARLGVAAAMRQDRGPRRPLIGHVLAVTGIVTVWLAASAQALLLLANLGPAGALALPMWDLLPALAFGSGLIEISLALAVLLLALPIWAWFRQRRESDLAAWFWREEQPTRPGDLPSPPEAGRSVPTFWAIALPGVCAGLVAGLFPLAILLVGEGIEETVRTSDAFALALGFGIEAAILVAGIVVGLLGALSLPRRWWPAALASALIAMLVAGFVAWVVLTANRLGLLQHSTGVSGVLGASAVRILLLRPIAEAAVPCSLVVALVASLRLSLRRNPEEGEQRSAARRTALIGVVAASLSAVLLVPSLLRVGQLTEPVLATSAVQVTLPAGWEGRLDAGSGGVALNTTAMDVQVLIAPAGAAAEPLGAGAIVVDGVQAPLVLSQDQGLERLVVFDAATPNGVQRISIAGTPEALILRNAELDALFAAIRWLPAD